MHIFYSTEDKALQPNGAINWYQAARLVDCKQQRKPISTKTRDIVKAFGDQMTAGDLNTNVKHFVPYCRISRQIIKNITQFEGKGMTREGSVAYLQHILEGLEINFGEWGEPTNAPWEDRMAFDHWMSWAIALVCDWPENLFQGQSWGDNQGRKLDVPKFETTGPALKGRVGDAAQKLKYFIKGLSLEAEVDDEPAREYEEYIPGEDEWYLP